MDWLERTSLTPLYNKYCRNATASTTGADPSSTSTTDPALLQQDSYLAYVSDLPGKNYIIEDNCLRDSVLAPLRGDPIPIRKFDRDALIAAFTLRPGIIPGVDTADFGVLDAVEISVGKERGESKSTVTVIPVTISKPTIKIKLGVAIQFILFLII